MAALIHSYPFRAFPIFRTPSFLSRPISPPNHLSLRRHVTLKTSSISWDDVTRISQPEPDAAEASDLSGYADKVKAINRGVEMQSEFRPLLIEDQVVGYVHHEFVENLRSYADVFAFPPGRVALNSSLRSADERTKAVGDVVKSLGEEVFPGIRNELYPVTSAFGAPVYFSLERAAAPFFGIKSDGGVVESFARGGREAYGIHMCGYVEKDGEKYLWVAKRSQQKPTYPGMLDHLVAGGLPHGVSCGNNVVKECEEEAGIPISISRGAVPVGAVSYMDINGYSYKRDVLFCYDLKLPESFMPENQDGEVESFRLISVSHVANIIRRTHFFKPNCSLVIIDFLFRHGYITPESFGYLDLLQSLRSGSCS